MSPVLGHDARTQLDNVFGLMHVHDARVTLGQPFPESRFRTTDDRRYIPEGIVQIQCYRAYVVHVLPTAPLWTTIVIRFNKPPQPG